MYNSAHEDHPVPGLYEQVITHQLRARIEELRGKGWEALEAGLEEATTPRILARHIAAVVEQHLSALSPLEQVLQSNLLLNDLHGETASEVLIAEGPRQLLGLSLGTGTPPIPRPSTPMSEATLITNREEAIKMGAELRSEIASADSIDLLCSFVKWSGTNTIRAALQGAKERGVPLRILTTTYMGATEAKAIDRLVRDFGAEVRINYESTGAHVHAKAWLFHRKTGFHTAYVGSSNLSQSALSTGLEWNVRLSPVSAPSVLRTFEQTFQEYWDSGQFEVYDPEHDSDRLKAAIKKWKWTPTSTPQHILSESMRAHPHQLNMLDQLAAEREVHQKQKALLVSPTGTGKTVIAALDYRSLREKYGQDLSLLFVAHTKEILEQAQTTYRRVLRDPRFGELHVDGKKAKERKHVFASIQSFQSQNFLESFKEDHFQVLVVDEFHHSAADTYVRLLGHFNPEQMLGLTATPERHDGHHVHERHFGGRIAAEMRLWQALDSNLLSPFHYYGIADDSAQFAGLSWSKGYDQGELTTLLTKDSAHANLVVEELYDKVAEPTSMRALGFCVSVKHAKFMADYFQEQGIEAKALDGNTPSSEREEAFTGLREGKIQALFSVNLFNEGLDIPDVDTLLFLRPTESVTVYLQQFGRGLRRTEGKDLLTVLDFVGHHRDEYSFEDRLHAITGLRRDRLINGIERDTYGLPDGSEIILDRKSKDLIIRNIRARLNLHFPKIVKEVKEYGEIRLASYLEKSMREITDVYRNRNSWTKALRDSQLIKSEVPEGEAKLLNRMAKFLHVDDTDRIDAYIKILSAEDPRYEELSSQGQLFARMLVLNIWDDGGGFSSYHEALEYLAQQPTARDEAVQILTYVRQRIEHLPLRLGDPHAHLPLRVHSTYMRAEILTALNYASIEGNSPSQSQSGVEWCEEEKVDALFVTLVKEDKDFKEDVRYKDYAIDAEHFHWESQKTAAPHTKNGQRHQNHKRWGSHVFLFVRKLIATETGRSAYKFLGPADYVSHSSQKPMQIIWKLQHDAPGDILAYSPAAA